MNLCLFRVVCWFSVKKYERKKLSNSENSWDDKMIAYTTQHIASIEFELNGFSRENTM